MSSFWDKLVCKLIGHEPRGPISEVPVLYLCERCDSLLRFDKDRGWLVYHE